MFPSLRQTILLVLIAVTCTVMIPVSVRADSLWQRRNPRRAYLFEDSRARRVGDLLTIVIDQSTEVDNSESRDLNKSTSAGVAYDLDSTTGGDLGTSAANASLDASGSSERSFSGAATYTNSREFQDRITVRVIDIDPAGNLVIQGSRGTHVTGEHRILHISGTVRPIDIAADNSLNSRFITDMHLFYEAEGAEPRFTKQGWLGRFVNKIWPF